MIRVLFVLALFVALAGCNDEEPAPAPSTEAPPATTDCGVVETIPIQGEGHLVGDQDPPVPYNSTPPTSGWHTSGDIPIEVASEPLTEPEQVTVLELGGVVVAHNGLDPSERTTLEDLLTEEYPGEAASTEYDKLEEGEVALTSWGRLQHCDALDLEAVEAFIAAYAKT